MRQMITESGLRRLAVLQSLVCLAVTSIYIVLVGQRADSRYDVMSTLILRRHAVSDEM